MAGNEDKYILRTKRYNEQKGKCYYCKEPMRLRRKGDDSKLRQGDCTLEHLDDRYSPYRGMLSGLKRTVAACYKCNNQKAQERNAEALAGTLKNNVTL